jgi:hypothetical protein
MTSMYCYWPFAMLARRSDVLAAEIACEPFKAAIRDR